jgi:glycosyltransferase involved in cell wall biosynthesis
MGNDGQSVTKRESSMNFCMVAYSFYESDNRVRRYAETLVQEGHSVDAVALRKPGQARHEAIKGVSVHRIQERKIDEKGKLSYLYRLLKFFFLSSCWLTAAHFRKHYKVIHVHSVPDFEVFAALMPKLFGARVILDIHDIVPEFFADKFGVKQDSFLVRALKIVEKLCCGFADHVIIANDIWYKKLTERSVSAKKCTTVLNYPTDIFSSSPISADGDGKTIMIYPGTMAVHQGLDIAIEACRKIKESIPQFEFHMYGKGPEWENLQEQISRLELSDTVFLHGMVSMEEISRLMSEAHIGVVPKRAKGFGDEAFSTKIFEYMAVGIPVIASKTTIDSYYFSNGSVLFFQSGNADDLADKVLFLLQDSESRQRQIKVADAFLRQNRWENKKHQYLDIIDKLTA